MRAELVVDAVVIAFAEEVEVEVRQLRGEEVRVVPGEFVAVSIAHAEPVGLERTTVGDAALEQPRRV